MILPFPAKPRSPSDGPRSVATARHSPEVFLLPGLLSPIAIREAFRVQSAQLCFRAGAAAIRAPIRAAPTRAEPSQHQPGQPHCT